MIRTRHCLPRPSHCLGLLLTMVLSGCTGDLLTQPSAPPAIYLLEANTNSSVRANPSGPTLAINPVRAAPGYDSSDMIYVAQAHQLQAFAHHRWADSPAHMLEPLLVAMAEHSGLFAGVTEPGNYVQTGLRLDSELLQLQQVFNAGSSTLNLTLRASLIDTAQGRIVASRVFQITEPVVEATPYGGVLAANRATARLMTELQAFIRHAITP